MVPFPPDPCRAEHSAHHRGDLSRRRPQRARRILDGLRRWRVLRRRLRPGRCGHHNPRRQPPGRWGAAGWGLHDGWLHAADTPGQRVHAGRVRLAPPARVSDSLTPPLAIRTTRIRSVRDRRGYEPASGPGRLPRSRVRRGPTVRSVACRSCRLGDAPLRRGSPGVRRVLPAAARQRGGCDEPAAAATSHCSSWWVARPRRKRR